MTASTLSKPVNRTNPPRRKNRSGRTRKSSREGYKVNWWLTALMLVASLTVLLPLYFTVAMALKSPDQIGTGQAWPGRTR